MLTVADDGVGFDVDAAWGTGLGLIGMRERLENIDGTITIAPRPAPERPDVVVPLHVTEDALPSNWMPLHSQAGRRVGNAHECAWFCSRMIMLLRRVRETANPATARSSGRCPWTGWLRLPSAAGCHRADISMPVLNGRSRPPDQKKL